MEFFGKKLSNVSLDEYKSRINNSLEKAGKRVVVVMDDIDRLSISEIEVVFRLIKLVANFNNTVYLLSFDDELVASALDRSYSKGGYDYLEKKLFNYLLDYLKPKYLQFVITL
ncbi:P-loop NTPase fold protein [Algoriphagus boritolerans]|uniref:P-loop NTPase fold protein n=1 Tax=Algoriphagus boritolerans TaxID=308111 RepID=UPI000A42B87D